MAPIRIILQDELLAELAELELEESMTNMGRVPSVPTAKLPAAKLPTSKLPSTRPSQRTRKYRTRVVEVYASFYNTVGVKPTPGNSFELLFYSVQEERRGWRHADAGSLGSVTNAHQTLNVQMFILMFLSFYSNQFLREKPMISILLDCFYVCCTIMEVKNWNVCSG